MTEAGLESEGLRFHETHRDAAKMARAAASTYRVSGFGSAVVPLDMCVEAEALGATVDFREGSEAAEFPRVTGFLHDSVEDFTAKARRNEEEINKNSVLSVNSVVSKGRIPIVVEAIKLLKEDVGEEIVIGAWVPGPFTLLSLLVETGALYMSLRKSKEQVHDALEFLTQVLAAVGNAYHEAGADFLTIHEMGGSPGALGPKIFEFNCAAAFADADVRAGGAGGAVRLRAHERDDEIAGGFRRGCAVRGSDEQSGGVPSGSAGCVVVRESRPGGTSSVMARRMRYRKQLRAWSAAGRMPSGQVAICICKPH